MKRETIHTYAGMKTFIVFSDGLPTKDLMRGLRIGGGAGIWRTAENVYAAPGRHTLPYMPHLPCRRNVCFVLSA